MAAPFVHSLYNSWRLTVILACLQLFYTIVLGAPQAVDHARNITYVGMAGDGIESFRGIRFGQDTASYRFKHPKPFHYTNSTTVQATQAGPACPQKTDELFLGFNEATGITRLSEDCLNLRIDRPRGTSPNAQLPVMVWVYGGGDDTGSYNESIYTPTALVLGAAQKRTPVIFVAMNYRVNVFGFANTPALAGEGSLNSGLLDQHLALQWIHNNIQYFGGNPKQVTLFGQSDGATGIGLQITAYGGKGPAPPFQRAIFESGSPTGDPGVTGNFTEQSTRQIATLTNCTTDTAEATLACLRKLPMTALLEAVLKFENSSSTTPQDIFFPVVDGTFIPAAPSKLLRTGRFHKGVSVIAGWNYNDGSIFSNPQINSSQALEGFLQVAYPHLTGKTVGTLLDMYPATEFLVAAQSYNISPEFLRSAQIYRDVNFACPAIYTAQKFAASGSPAYLYELNATAFAPLLVLAGAQFEGVFHISDIPFIFNDADQYSTTADVVRVQRQMSGSWANFVAQGKPSGAANTTLPNWSVAFDQGAAQAKRLTQAGVRVIGGPSDGTSVLGFGSGIEPQLLKRCQFINTPDFYEQIQT